MVSLTRAKIRALASNDAVFSRAESYARSGRVSIVNAAHCTDIYEVTAIVKGARQYDVYIQLDTGDLSFIDASCNCPAYAQYAGLCKHAVAALLVFMNNKLAQARTDNRGSFMLNMYKQLDQDSAQRELEGSLAYVRLNPALELSYGFFHLRLKAGRSRMYVVKDFSELYLNMKNGARAVYGQQFTWVHSMESIDPEDRPLMRLILEYCDVMCAPRGYSTYSERIGPALSLTDTMLDKFMMLMMETKGEVFIREQGRERGLLLIQDNPRLRAHIQREGSKGMRLLLDPVMFAVGARFLYLIHDKHVLLADDACKKSLEPLLSAISANGDSLFFAKKDVPAFFGSVYPTVEPYIEFSGDTFLAEEYLPLPLHCRLNLDAPASDRITCRVLFTYEGAAFNPLEGASPAQIRRDIREEAKKSMQLERIFPRMSAEHYVFEGDDEQIYNFLTEQTTLLEQIGELYVSDRLKRLVTPPATRVGASVKLESDLLRLDIDVSGFEVDELWAVLEAYRASRRFYRLKSGQFLSLEDDAIGSLSELAQTLSLDEAALAQGSLSLPAYRALYLDNLLRGREQLYYRRNDRFKALVRNIRNVEDSDFPVPDALRDTLRNYQKTGYRWMRTLIAANLNGLLADDMGLGKTIQVIAVLLAMKLGEGAVKALVVCPASLVLNWKTEVERFGKALRVTALTGAAAYRRGLVTEGDYDIIVTSYDQLKRDIACYEPVSFDFEILDEAQTIKNASTQAAKAVKAIRARHRFALTGTPVENRLSELWSIFDFLMPGYLFSYKRFRERYEVPAVRQQDEEALRRLNKLASPFILRRMKAEVLKELPDKVETVKMTELAGEQKKLYVAHMLNVQKEISASLETDTLARDKLKILALLTRLRQICCDPALFVEDYQGESAKLELCMELVGEAVRSGHRVLLFSQFTSMLELIEKKLEDAGIGSYMLRGSTPKRRRQEYIAGFQGGTGAPVFLISLKAGGLGLNLTKADVVILYDPWWNTAAENQAADRAYRMGQTKNVQIIRLIAKGTIEERILDLQQKKSELASSVISEGNALQTLTSEDWNKLLTYES